MSTRVLSKEEFNRLKGCKECPACGAYEKFFRKIFSDLSIVSCSLCGSQISEHAYGNSNPTYLLKIEKEFVKSKEEALQYLEADKANILSHGRNSSFVTKDDIEDNAVLSIRNGKAVGVNDNSYNKPYALYKTKHLLNESDIECGDEDNVVCPYCGYEDSDSWEYDDSDSEETTCGRCEREFYLTTRTVRTYTTTRKDGEAEKLPS